MAAGLFPIINGCSNAMKNLENLGFVIPTDIFNYEPWDYHCHAIEKTDGIISQLKNCINNHPLEVLCKKWHPYSLHNYSY